MRGTRAEPHARTQTRNPHSRARTPPPHTHTRTNTSARPPTRTAAAQPVRPGLTNYDPRACPTTTTPDLFNSTAAPQLCVHPTTGTPALYMKKSRPNAPPPHTHFFPTLFVLCVYRARSRPPRPVPRLPCNVLCTSSPQVLFGGRPMPEGVLQVARRPRMAMRWVIHGGAESAPPRPAPRWGAAGPAKSPLHQRGQGKASAAPVGCGRLVVRCGVAPSKQRPWSKIGAGGPGDRPPTIVAWVPAGGLAGPPARHPARARPLYRFVLWGGRTAPPPLPPPPPPIGVRSGGGDGRQAVPARIHSLGRASLRHRPARAGRPPSPATAHAVRPPPGPASPAGPLG
jgi:hypothetical protein